MKAVIVEIKDSVAAVLSEDGRISKIKNKNYAIGQEITLKNNNKFIKMAVSAAAALTVIVTPAWAYLTPYSYVSLDINPSFEFSINRFDRVLEVTAVNDDGEEIVEKISINELKNKEINEAVKNVLVELKEQGYIIQGKEGGVVVATASKSQEKTDKLAAALKTSIEEEVTFVDKKAIKNNQEEASEKETVQTVQTEEAIETIETEENKKPEKSDDAKEIKENLKEEAEEIKEDNKNEVEEIKENLEEDKEKLKEAKETIKEATKESRKNNPNKFTVEVIEVSQDDVDEAKEYNSTPGKYNLVMRLKEYAAKAGDEEVDVDYWLEQPVQVIIGKINDYKNNESQEKNEMKNEGKSKEAGEQGSGNKSNGKGSKN